MKTAEQHVLGGRLACELPGLASVPTQMAAGKTTAQLRSETSECIQVAYKLQVPGGALVHYKPPVHAAGQL